MGGGEQGGSHAVAPSPQAGKDEDTFPVSWKSRGQRISRSSESRQSTPAGRKYDLEAKLGLACGSRGQAKVKFKRALLYGAFRSRNQGMSDEA
jgi:hypothetical protein